MAKKRRINKKKFIFVVLVFVLIIYLIVKILLGIGNFIDKRKNPQPLPKVKTSEEIEEEKNRKINIIVDPAKGGKEKGLVGYRGSQYEKDLNLDIAKQVEANLSKHSDVNVTLTRGYDSYMNTKDRVKFAKKNKGDIMISIRINAQAGGNEASGMDVYYSSPNSSFISKKEAIDEHKDKTRNTSDYKKSKNIEDDSDSKSDDEKQHDSSKREDLSKYLAESIQSVTLSFVSFKDRGIKEDSYDILNYTEMPAVIVHSGFITNKEDVETLETQATRDEIANGISEGILRFIDQNRNKIIKDRINFR